MDKSEKLTQKLSVLPELPGVYLMKNADDEIIYVGKALNLKNRIRSYFSGKHDMKTTVLVENIVDLDYIITTNENEAFILEANLVRKHKPKYNIMLKDDKKYPFLKITLFEDFPRILVERELTQDGSRYFGPYLDVGAMRRTLSLLEWIFPLRSCNLKIIENENKYDRPCINYQLKKCLGPCIAKISKQDYRKIIKNVIHFLQGKDNEVISSLREDMNTVAEQMKFEEAAVIRDKIQGIEKLQKSQNIYFTDGKDRDVIGLYQMEQYAAVAVLKILSGKLLNRETYRMENVDQSTPEELMEAFIEQYYANRMDKIPDSIICQIAPANMDELNKVLKNKLFVPQRGDLSKLMSIAKQNAFTLVENEKLRHIKSKERTVYPVKELKDKLNLIKLPRRMCCFDISTIQGTDTVASLVFFENGKPRKKNYRKFIIKTVGQQDDFACMQEATTRYFNRLSSGEEEEKPDLVVIDGGKGQLNAAGEILREKGLEGIEIISLAKRVEEVFKPGSKDSIILPRNSSALKLLVHLRDEAHRFAVTFHRQRRSGRTLTSELDTIKGISENMKFTLLKEIGSVEKISSSEIEDLTKIKGIGKKLAEKIISELNKNQ